MPPEQLRNEEVDEHTDQWALAAVAFETLADGSRPATSLGFWLHAGRTGVSVLTRFCAEIM
jgi:hypothetical protein